MVRALEAENRLFRQGLAENSKVSNGGDGGGDAAPERARELGVETVSADNDHTQGDAIAEPPTFGCNPWHEGYPVLDCRQGSQRPTSGFAWVEHVVRRSRGASRPYSDVVCEKFIVKTTSLILPYDIHQYDLQPLQLDDAVT